MPNFSDKTIEPLIYDFTGFPRNDGKGMCSGKGVIPEPTQKALEAYQDGIRKLYDIEDDEDAEEAINQSAEESDEEAENRLQGLLRLTAELCKGTPSKEELSALPPRLKLAFLKWVYKELADPEV